MIHISLFSGIGGADLAAEWAGWETYATCEINPFGKKILQYYWPNAYHHEDIHTLTYERINDELIQRFGANWRNQPVIITGGFPCQPYSQSGKRKGTEDPRHLWPEMLRIIREVAPDWVVGENVFGLTNWSKGLVFEQVQIDLEDCGYEVQPFILPACGVNAPHRRDRVWFVAHSNNTRTGIGLRSEREWQTVDEGRSEQLLNKFGENGNASENTIGNGCLLGESIEKGTEIRQFGNIGTGSSDGVYLSEGIEQRGERITPNPTITGRKERIESNGRTDSKENRTGVDNRPERSGNNRVVADPDCGRRRESTLQSELRTGIISKPSVNSGLSEPSENGEGQERDRRIEGFRTIPTFDQFPTQSPVRRGDDGIPDRLDSITVSKWRNESIKGLGNSWVPQVAYQIFKVINEYTKISLNNT